MRRHERRPEEGRLQVRGIDHLLCAHAGGRNGQRSCNLLLQLSKTMISAEQNELRTRVGPGTPAGKLLRSYWQPVALVDEMQGPRPVKAVRIFSENFVLFRDEKGRYGLLDRHCPHRGADLAYGRLEDGGLRCAFHGWLFDVAGRCLQTPAQPEGSRLCERVRQRSYPLV